MSDISYPLNALVGAPQPVKPVTADETEAHQFEQPGWGKLFGAAFRTENMVGSALSQDEVENPYRKQDGFDWLARYNSLPEEMRVLHGDKFTDIHNDRSFDALEAKITRENADKQLLASSGWRGTVASITAGLADLPTLIPVGGEYMAAARGIKGVSLAAARFAAENAGAQAVQEVGLHATQETRTATDSAINVGAGAVLGFMLGGAGAALLTRGEREIAENAITRVLDPAADVGEVSGSAASVGAAAVDRLTREENTPAGTIGKALTQVSQINPNNRLNMSASNAAREIGQQLGDNAIYQVAHESGKTLGPSAEIAARASMQGRMAEGLEAHQSIWKEYRKANGAWLLGRGSSMTAEEFDNAVGRAMRRGDVAESGDQYVTKAAQEWRRKVFDPLKKEAIDAGLLPPDVATETADSYLHRWWNKQALMQNEREVKGVFRDYFIGRLKEVDDANWREAQRRIAKVEEEKTAWKQRRQSQIDAAFDEIGDIEINKLRRQESEKSAIKRSDMREEGLTSGDVIRMARAMQTGAFKRPDVETLTSWLHRTGGLVDEGGELQRIGITSRSRPGFVKSERVSAANSRGGRTLDDAARAAWEEGFFPHMTERPTVREFLDALEGDFSGMSKSVREADLVKANAAQLYDDVDASLTRLGYANGKRVATDDEIESLLPKIRAAMEEIDRQRIAALEAKAERIKAEIDGGDYIISRNKRQAAIKSDYEYRSDFELDASNAYASAAEDAASAVYDKLTGRVFDEAVADIPDWIVPVVRGPLKERTFNIPDALVEKYLNSNIRDVAHKYARTMAADIELTRKFGRADMRDQIQRIVADYQDMRDKVYAAKTVEEARKVVGDTPGIGDWLREKRGADALGAAKEKLVADLNKAERADLNDVKTVRDIVRGTYGKDQNETWKRISNAATAYNYIRLMGGNVIANMSDIYRPAMVHGLLPYFRDAVLPLMTNMKAVKLSIEEARKAGLVAERIMQSRLMSFAEIGDRYASDTAFERLMQNGAKIASRWNGILHLTDFNQAMASVLTQDRMISAMLEGKEGRYLAYLGIDKNMAQRIGKQLEAHAENVNGVWVANTDKWADPHGVLARTYRAAMRKDVDSIIVQRSAGDVPLFANTPTGKMLLQFKAFNLAAHQRVLIRSTQEGPANFVSGLVGMTSLGIMASYLRAYRGGEDRWQKFQQAAQNPGYLIGEGLDLSGLFTLGFEPVNMIEKTVKVNPVKDLIKAPFGDPNVGESQRYASRGVVATFLGPSASLIDTAADVAQRAKRAANGESTEANTKALKRQAFSMVPYSSYFGPREVVNMLAGF